MGTETKLRVLERAFEDGNVGIVVTDARREGDPVVYANEGFERITGRSAGGVAGVDGRRALGLDEDGRGVEELD